MSENEIPQNVLDVLNEMSEYANDVEEWVLIKRRVLNSLPPCDRKLFSTRDPKTKKQSFNEFELRIVDWWEKKTGKRLQILK
jgi:hypothetical protein